MPTELVHDRTRRILEQHLSVVTSPSIATRVELPEAARAAGFLVRRQETDR